MIRLNSPLKVGALFEVDGHYVDLGFYQALQVQTAITPDGQMIEMPEAHESKWVVNRYRIEEIKTTPDPLMHGIITISLDAVSVYTRYRQHFTYEAGRVRFIEPGTPPTEKPNET